MEFLIYIGGVFVALGLGGIGYCVVAAVKIKREKSDPKDETVKLQRLVAWNMGSLGMSAMGLSMIVIGMLL